MEQQIGDLFLQRQFDVVYDATSQEFQQFIARAEFRELCDEFIDGVKNLKLAHQNPFLHMYNYVWVDEREEKALFVTMGRDGVIQGLYMKPYVQFYEDNKNYTKNMFRMPVTGEWYVFWGGANEFQNYHYPYENQRFAYDLVKEKDHQTFEKHQHLYTSYYAYNEQIVAPCDGKVVAVVQHFEDQEIGQTDEQNPTGNYIILEHKFDEYSMIAHLKKDSVVVKLGDEVVAGQLLARCGNSGNTSEPHIHFQVMDGPEFELSKSLRIRFTDRFEPVQGSTVDSVSYFNEEKDATWEKIEGASMLAEILSFIPRIFFK